jgi:Putative oxidoreductase C terminal domain
MKADLCYYFGGEVNYFTIRVHTFEHFKSLGKLFALSINESTIPPERRIPWMTVTSWKFESGAVCSFTHGLVLHGFQYDTMLEVYCENQIQSLEIVGGKHNSSPFVSFL